MLPDLALIVSAYALVRLANEYLFAEEHQYRLRGILALIAILVIGVALFDVLAAGSLAGL